MAVKVRLVGEEPGIRAALQALHDAPGMRVVDTSGARPTRYGEGVRVYAVVETSNTLRAEDATAAERAPGALPPPRA